jgi:hypothetical protein
MKPVVHIFIQSFAKPFYTRNSGFFLFIFILMFGVVQGGMLLAYHHKLIMGVLTIPVAFYIVLLLWGLYFMKCAAFVANTLSQQESVFLNIINRLPAKITLALFFGLQVLLGLPVLLYATAMIGVAMVQHFYVHVVCIVLFLMLACIFCAAFYRRACTQAGLRTFIALRISFPRTYFSALVSVIFHDLPYLYAGFKIFSVMLLYIFLGRAGDHDPDLRMLWMLLTIAMLGHGVIIQKLRQIEESRLLFYRQLPVNLVQRWVQYVLFYVFLVAPETLVVIKFVPYRLPVAEGTSLLLFFLSLLLFLHALLSAVWLPPRTLLKISFIIFAILYFFILAGAYWVMVMGLFFAATFVFLFRYHRFELKGNPV